MDVISKLFNIKDSKTCIFGGTIIDIDIKSGHNKEDMLSPSNKIIDTACPEIGVELYTNVKDFQDSYDPKSFPKSLMDTWINGFVPNNKGLPSAEGVCDITKEYLNKLSILKFDQLYPNREEGVLDALFSFLSFYGKKESILDVEDTGNYKERLINKGIVCKNWLNNPIQIRYVLRREGEGDALDYIYLLGGSPIILSNNPEDVIPELQTCYKKYIYGNEFLFSKNKKSYRVWDEITPEIYNNFPVNDKDKIVATIQFLRTLSGIIFIRNYLYYAYHILGIESIVEFEGDNIRKLPTKKVLSLYEESYLYCKTVSQLIHINRNDLDTTL